VTWMIIILIAILLLPTHSDHRKINVPISKPQIEKLDEVILDEVEKDEPIKQLQDEKRKRRLFPRLLRKTRRT
jgi:hypothetical protein